MASSRERAANRSPAAEGLIHDQEVVRARKELAAYFKGLRTEREARSALKIIKAFVREREKIEATKRRPLPGMRPARIAPRRKPRRTATQRQTKTEAASSPEQTSTTD